MLRSLRSRIVLASVFWTAGLLAVLHMLSVHLVHVFPELMRVPHTGTILLGLTLMVAGFVVTARALGPLHGLQPKLSAVRAGRQPHVGGVYPSEVQPVIEELNALLDDRERAVRRAQSAAGDLAHGLKTPLALLSQIAVRAKSAGIDDIGASIAQHVEHMSRQVNYQLARTRAAASGRNAAPIAVAPRAEALVRTVRTLYAERPVTIDSAIDPDLSLPVLPEDLDELLGNILDNACKWTESRVSLRAEQSGASIKLAIDDDGPGLAPKLRQEVLKRGVRADQSAPGTGLGLAIVRDLTQIYGGAIELTESPLGGLRVQLSLPATSPTPHHAQETQ